MLRSIISVIAGFIAWYIAVFVLWIAFGYGPREIPPTDFLVFSICMEAIFSVGGGYLTALIAGRKEMLHSIILAAVFCLLGVISLILYDAEKMGSIWLPLSTIVINAPCAVLGGWMRKKSKNRTR